jgi:hypothetical protein
MMDKSRAIKRVLQSTPVMQQLDLPSRAELLPKILSGELEFLDFRAKVFSQGPNANFVMFRDADMAMFAASFSGKPYLRDHDTEEIESREGTIMSSAMVGMDMIQDIRISTRSGMQAYIEGQMDRFSVGWDCEDVICTICNTSWRSTACAHWPGRKYSTAQGEQTCSLLFINPVGVETSAVNVPAVDGTSIIMALQQQKYEIMSGELAALNEKPQLQNQPQGQAPEVVESLESDGARARLNSLARRLAIAELSLTPQGALIMNVRELLKKRADSLAAARGLHETADEENRDLSVEERAEFERLMTETESLSTQIGVIQDERARLMAAEGKDLSGSDAPEKPVAANSKLMKRDAFNQLSQADRAVFMRGGGKIED